MKNLPQAMQFRRIFAAISGILLLFSFFSGLLTNACATYVPDSGWLNYIYGGYIYIPNGFVCSNYDVNRNGAYYGYDYYNAGQQMSFLITEGSTSVYPANVISSEYSRLMNELPTPTYKNKTSDSFTLSGYSGGGSWIYYIAYQLAHNTVYTVQFEYPVRNRGTCDRMVENIIASFHPTGSQAYEPAYGIPYNVPFGTPSGKPSAADLDAIHSDIKYPAYSWFYLDSYVYAYVTHEAVYCFKDPDSDIWRNGNYFTVYRGTQVTILAESQGYACVILTGTRSAGWINLNYLSAR